MKIQQLSTQDQGFWQQLDALLAWETVSDEAVLGTVNEIIQ